MTRVNDPQLAVTFPLSQWGPGQSPGRCWFWSILNLAVMRHRYAGACVQRRKFRKKFLVHSVAWAYFPNGPNAAASIAPTLIRHCDKLWRSHETTIRCPKKITWQAKVKQRSGPPANCKNAHQIVFRIFAFYTWFRTSISQIQFRILYAVRFRTFKFSHFAFYTIYTPFPFSLPTVWSRTASFRANKDVCNSKHTS